MVSRFLHRPLEVKHANLRPLALFLRGRWVAVREIQDYWRDAGRWWAGEPEKHFYRVLAGNGGVYEIFRQPADGRWFLYRVYD